MISRISPISWTIFALTVVGAFVLALNVDLTTRLGVERLIASVLVLLAAALTLANGARVGARLAAIETGRYPRPKAGAVDRILQRIRSETAQTVTVDGEGGDDVREVAAVLRDALLAANWQIRDFNLGGSLFNGGRGILVYHTQAAASAATALIAALQDEGWPATYAGDCATGLPIQITFRRP